MNIIVNANKQYNGWTSLGKLQDIAVVVGDIQYLVYHKSPESVEDCIKYLTIATQAHPEMTMIYVRNRQDTVQPIRILVEGSGGKYLDDEFFIEDSAQLDQLVANLKEVTSLAEMSGVNVIGDFIHRYTSTSGKGISSAYLQVVKSAAEEMATAYRDKSLEVLKLCESASDLFKGSVELISNIQEEQSKLEGMVADLRGKVKSDEIVANIPIAPQVGYFPRVTYLKNRVSIIRIKDIGRSPYLTSFAMGFRNYLQDVCKVRPKLVIIEPLGEVLPTLYKDYSWVTQQTKNDISSYSGNVVFTNYPLKDVMEKLLSDPNYDTVIVLDRLTISGIHLLNCQGREPFYCVKGNSSVNALKLNIRNCFSVVSEVSGSLFTIPMFTEYPVDAVLRERKYMSECETFYKMLYTVKAY